jgi:Flp pilus assembly protein TadG
VAVEFALLLPLLVLLVFGIIDLGRVLNAQITVSQAAREGARLAALANPNACSRAAAAGTGLSLTCSGNVTITGCASNADQTNDAQARVQYAVSGLILFPGITVTGTGVMPCQG